MPKGQVKYEPDHDEAKYEARKKVYINQGYTPEEKIESNGKSCILTRDNQPRILISFEGTNKTIAKAK